MIATIAFALLFFVLACLVLRFWIYADKAKKKQSADWSGQHFTTRASEFRCRAGMGHLSSEIPRDCGWPACGCDPHAGIRLALHMQFEMDRRTEQYEITVADVLNALAKKGNYGNSRKS